MRAVAPGFTTGSTHASFVVIPTDGLEGSLRALGLRGRRRVLGSGPLSLADGELACVSVGGQLRLAGPEAGMGALAARASRVTGWALSFHVDRERDVVLAMRYLDGRVAEEVAEIQGERSGTGGGVARSGRLDAARLGALERAWGAEALDPSAPIEVVVAEPRWRWTARLLGLVCLVGLLGGLVWGGTRLLPSAESRCVARCEARWRATWAGTADCPGPVETCEAFLESARMCAVDCLAPAQPGATNP